MENNTNTNLKSRKTPGDKLRNNFDRASVGKRRVAPDPTSSAEIISLTRPLNARKRY